MCCRTLFAVLEPTSRPAAVMRVVRAPPSVEANRGHIFQTVSAQETCWRVLTFDGGSATEACMACQRLHSTRSRRPWGRRRPGRTRCSRRSPGSMMGKRWPASGDSKHRALNGEPCMRLSCGLSAYVFSAVPKEGSGSLWPRLHRDCVAIGRERHVHRSSILHFPTPFCYGEGA